MTVKQRISKEHGIYVDWIRCECCNNSETSNRKGLCYCNHWKNYNHLDNFCSAFIKKEVKDE